MGHIKDIRNQPKLQSFPSSTYEIVGDVPASQCQVFQITFAGGITTAGQTFIRKIGTFRAINLAAKKVTVTFPPADAGLYNVLSNDDDFIFTDHIFIVSGPASAGTVHDAGQAYLTRNIQSFAQFIAITVHTYTIKGGKLYTTLPTAIIPQACALLFNPLT